MIKHNDIALLNLYIHGFINVYAWTLQNANRNESPNFGNFLSRNFCIFCNPRKRGKTRFKKWKFLKKIENSFPVQWFSSKSPSAFCIPCCRKPFQGLLSMLCVLGWKFGFFFCRIKPDLKASNDDYLQRDFKRADQTLLTKTQSARTKALCLTKTFLPVDKVC